MDNIGVNCYSGYTFAERPESFTWRGIEYKVQQLEKEWREPGRKLFKVRTGDNKLFQLCYNETKHNWSLIELVGD